MAGIKKLNSTKPGVLRPVQASDLQDIWDGLANALASDTITSATGDTEPAAEVRIISGMHVTDSSFITSGVIAYNGELYYFDGDTEVLQEDTILYLHKRNGPDRTLANGSVIPFYILNTVDSDPTDGVSIGMATKVQLDKWRMPLIPNDGINTGMIADGAVVASKLAANSVTTEKIVDNAVTTEKIADNAITGRKMGINSVYGDAVRDKSIGMRKLQGGSFVNPGTVYKLVAVKAVESYVANRDNIYNVTIPNSSNTIGISFELSTTGVYVFYVTNNKSESVTTNIKFPGVMSASLGNAPAGKTSKFTVYYCDDGSLITDQVTVVSSYTN